MMPSNNNYAAWVYGSLQWNAARFCSTERLASNPNPLRWDVCLWPELRQSRCHLARFPPHLPRALVGAQTEKRRVPEATLGRPLHEPHLRHQLRPHPLHLPHLAGRHAAAPAGRLRVRQVDEGTVIGVVRLQRLQHPATQVSSGLASTSRGLRSVVKSKTASKWVPGRGATTAVESVARAGSLS
jgi:hypothetical protein